MWSACSNQTQNTPSGTLSDLHLAVSFLIPLLLRVLLTSALRTAYILNDKKERPSCHAARWPSR